MHKKQVLTIGLLSLVIVLGIGLLLWLKPADSTPDSTALQVSHSSDMMSPIENTDAPIAPSSTAPLTLDGSLATSLQGTEIDCAIQADASGKLVLNINVKRCFEYFLSQLGEKPLNVIDQQVQQHLNQILAPTAAQQAMDLWQRYLKYREAESKINVNSSTSDPDHLQQVFNALNHLRQQYFDATEMTALFGDEMTYNQYTIDRVNIMQNKSLSANEKAQQLKQRFAQLPPDLQKNLSDMSKLQDLRELTQQIKQHHGSKAELRQMREQLVGAAAADRLEQLDQRRENWQTRINDYLSQRDAILNSTQADQDKKAAIDALRNRQFASEAERQRAISFEHFKDQNLQAPQ
ncbi:lipase secretion chaperone [Alkanindiges sp. WGS2144]|uniref:lipase secretion chaperone n=1 Tax=Alkanindiges sp. WGS2144 TaxID=3366808 RepID=UPI003751A1B7